MGVITAIKVSEVYMTRININTVTFFIEVNPLRDIVFKK